jgi:hypothetical protein
MRAFLIAMAIALAGCAATKSTLNYTRTDGAPVDAAKEEAVLTQCKGEGATTPVQSTNGAYGMIDRAQKEAAVVDACMARNGYIQAKQ